MKIPSINPLMWVTILLALTTTQARWETLVKLLLNLKPRSVPITFRPTNLITNPSPANVLAPTTLRSRANWLAEIRFLRHRAELLRPLTRTTQSRLARWRQLRRTQSELKLRQETLRKYVK